MILVNMCIVYKLICIILFRNRQITSVAIPAHFQCPTETNL